MDNEPAGEKFNAMHWNVLDLSNSKFRLLTSDWPLYREIRGEDKLFALPISPTALFTAVTRVATFEKMRREKKPQCAYRLASGSPRAPEFLYRPHVCRDRDPLRAAHLHLMHACR